MTQTLVRHPAKYTDALLPVFDKFLPNGIVIDPFAGTGKIHLLATDERHTYGLEIEPEWAEMHERTLRGNALDMVFPDESADAVCTSPTYGNRMADHHEAKDDSRRNTYRHALGRPLHACNSGAMQWGDEYRRFHERAWSEVHRVLRPGGIFVLNIKDHVRKGKQQYVSWWHYHTVMGLGFEHYRMAAVECPGNRQGENGNVRIPYEWVFAFRKKEA